MNCIFAGNCKQHICDQSCPLLAETSYLLERNGLAFNNMVFKYKDDKEFQKCFDVMDVANYYGFLVYNSSDTVVSSNLLTYCAIGQIWKGNTLHCSVLNIRYGEYLDMLRQSWSGAASPELEYLQIWQQSAKILIVSGIDYLSFKEFDCQSLLNLIQSRRAKQRCTILVIPKFNNINVTHGYFNALKTLMNNNTYPKLKARYEKEVTNT